MDRQFEKIKNSWGGFLLIIVLWMLIAIYARFVQDKPFPFPWEAAASLLRNQPGKAGIIEHTGSSLLRWTQAFIIASAAGTAAGLLMGIFGRLDRLLLPLVNVMQLIPGLAWVPVTLILFGLGGRSTIFVIAVTAVAPVIINTRTGIQEISPGFFRAADMMELKPAARFTKIILPGAAPSIISGLRIGAANGFRVLISAEMVIGSGLGLGYSLYQSRWTLDYDSAFGILIIIALTGLLIDKFIFSLIENAVRKRRGL